MGLIIITPFVARNNFKALQTDNMRLQIFRALINIISMICWFSAIGMMHFEKATALGFTTPLFTTVLAVFSIPVAIVAAFSPTTPPPSYLLKRKNSSNKGN